MKSIFVFLLNLYKNTLSLILRYLFGPGCRFTPTCSEYARDAVGEHGVVKGSWLSLKRVLSCHPGTTPRFDPVRPAQER